MSKKQVIYGWKANKEMAMKHLAGNIWKTTNGNLAVKRQPRINENDTATTRQEIDDGHKRYQEHIKMVRTRLGLGTDRICGCDPRARE